VLPELISVADYKQRCRRKEILIYRPSSSTAVQNQLLIKEILYHLIKSMIT